MKITPYDKLQALKHSIKYAEDYKDYVDERDGFDSMLGPPWACQVKLCEAGKRLCTKWGLQYPVVPRPELCPDQEEPDVVRGSEADRIKIQEQETSRVHSPIGHLDPPERWKEIESFSWADDPTQEVIIRIDSKLVLTIDTTYPRDQILEALKQYLNHWTKRSHKRTKPNEIDIWNVYRMHEWERKPILQIARELLGTEGNPSYDTNADRDDKKVKRACKKASKIIELIEAAIISRTPSTHPQDL